MWDLLPQTGARRLSHLTARKSLQIHFEMRKVRPRDMQEGRRSLRMLHGVGLGAGMGAEGHMAPQELGSRVG